MNNREDKQKRSRERQFVTFRLDGNYFGIDILSIKEVNIDYNITPVHHAPDMVEGYVNLRGEIFLILSLRKLLSLEEKKLEKSNLIIFKEEVADPFGIIVDSIGDVVTISDSMFQQFEQNEQSSQITNLKQSQNQIIEGICKVEKELIVAIDPKKIFTTLEASAN